MNRPNILILMCDQLQGRVLESDHICQTPHFDRLAQRGIRFERAYTPNAVCSPARASLMTGLHVHNHGVLAVTHTTDDDQSCLREEHPHWAQHLRDDGYLTAYFGKWHIERSFDLDKFGWTMHACEGSTELQQRRAEHAIDHNDPSNFTKSRYYSTPGYIPQLFYGVTKQAPEQRNLGITTEMALDFLDDTIGGEQPWCCMVSINEPHDPFVTGEQAYALYDAESLNLSPNVYDELADAPGIYRKASRVWKEFSEADIREAATCYYASITEIDSQYGRILDKLEATGELDNTIVVFVADHGELLGAHGMYCKNFGAYEEIYNVPLLISGPGIAQDIVTNARVGTHEFGPTLLEWLGAEPIDVPDSNSFAKLLPDPASHETEYTSGYAEYFGNRYHITQRVTWDGDWKFVHNGFDFDELYNLAEDPFEMHNLAEDPAYVEQLQSMVRLMWAFAKKTDDKSLLNTHYPQLRVAPLGPLSVNE